MRNSLGLIIHDYTVRLICSDRSGRFSDPGWSFVLWAGEDGMCGISTDTLQ